jgi:tRNA nucleotidyltransferase (CCA-adding enzyme)
MIPKMQNPFGEERTEMHAMRERFLREAPSAANAVTAIAEAVSSKNGRAYLVGGFVRDALRGIVSHDIDLEVYGVEGKGLKSVLEELFPTRVHVVGSAFGILHVALPDGVTLDVALPRRESKSGKGHRGFTVEGDPTMPLEDAARRRDFTVNAMLLDLASWHVVDPFNGQADLDAQLLRIIDPATFQDDPLRIYRAIQLSARLESTVEEKSLMVLRMMIERGDLAELSKERVTDELRKLLLRSEYPSRGFELARSLGVVERDMPELHALTKTSWTKTMKALDTAAELLLESQAGFSNDDALTVMLTALCSAIDSNGAKSLFSRWTFPVSVTQAAIRFVPMCLDIPRDESGLRQLVRRIAPTPWRVFILAAEAVSEKPTKKIRATLQDLEARGEFSPLLEGRDVLALGLTPGPRIGELLRAVEDARHRGEIKTREEALAFVQKGL